MIAPVKTLDGESGPECQRVETGTGPDGTVEDGAPRAPLCPTCGERLPDYGTENVCLDCLLDLGVELHIPVIEPLSVRPEGLMHGMRRLAVEGLVES